MTSDDNKAAVQRFFDEVINGDGLSRADEFVTANYVEHREPRDAKESTWRRLSCP
jgi:hypothetical protein